MDTKIKLSDTLRNKIIAELKKLGNIEVYWDYRDELSDEHKSQILAGKIDEVETELWEHNMDNNYDLEMERIKEVCEEFKTEFEAEIFEGEDFEWDEIKSEMRDEFLDYLAVDMNMKDLLRKSSVNVRIELHSNYDCMNSHWLESQSPFEMDSYFGDMVKALKMNPAKVKKMLIEKNMKTAGKFRDNKSKNEMVSYSDLWQEMENSSCGANLLTFVGKLDLSEFIGGGKPNKIKIPKGNNCGIFSSFQGGGSVIEMELLRDVTIDLEAHGKTKYDNFEMISDGDKDGGYSIDRVYGVTSSFWGGNIQILSTSKNEG